METRSNDAWLAEQVEKSRSEAQRAPETAAARRESLRKEHAVSHRDGIALFNKLIGIAVEVYRDLGEPPPREIETDPLDLSFFQLDDLIVGLKVTIREGQARLATRSAAAERENARAAETPAERLQRERAEAIEARFADLEARVAQLDQRYVPPARSLPPMSNAPVTHGAMGFVAGATVPPSQVNAPAGAQRVGSSVAQDRRPVLSHQRLERLTTDVSSPADFEKACR